MRQTWDALLQESFGRKSDRSDDGSIGRSKNSRWRTSVSSTGFWQGCRSKIPMSKMFGQSWQCSDDDVVSSLHLFCEIVLCRFMGKRKIHGVFEKILIFCLRQKDFLATATKTTTYATKMTGFLSNVNKKRSEKCLVAASIGSWSDISSDTLKHFSERALAFYNTDIADLIWDLIPLSVQWGK